MKRTLQEMLANIDDEAILSEDDALELEAIILEADESDADEDEKNFTKKSEASADKDDEDDDGEDEDEEEDDDADEDGDEEEDDEEDDDNEHKLKEAYHEEMEIYLEGVDFEADAKALNETVMGGALNDDELARLVTVLENAHKVKLRALAEGMIDNLLTLHEERLALEVESVETFLTEKTSAYLKERTEAWEKENAVPLQEARAVSAANALFEDLSAVLGKYGYSVNPNEELEEEVQRLSEELDAANEKANDAYEQVLALNESNIELQKRVVFLESTTDLSLMQIEKLRPFAEEIRADDIKTYSKKLALVLENVVFSDEDEDEEYVQFVEDFDSQIDESSKFIFEDEDDLEDEEITEEKTDSMLDDKVAYLVESLQGASNVK